MQSTAQLMEGENKYNFAVGVASDEVQISLGSVFQCAERQPQVGKMEGNPLAMEKECAEKPQLN